MALENSGLVSRVSGIGNKPLIGVPLHKFRLTIRVAGQKFHTELKGDLFDATSKFVNPEMMLKFKQVISDEIMGMYSIKEAGPIYEEDNTVFVSAKDSATTVKELAEKSVGTPNKSQIEIALNAFRAFPVGKVCRVLILKEDHSSCMHVILQFGRLALLTDYASLPSRLDAGLLRGQDVTFTCSGWGVSFPTKRKLPDGIGAGFIHWFIPDDPSLGSDVAVDVLKEAEVLSEIVPWMHQTIEIKEFKKAKEEQIKADEEALKEMGAEVAAASVELDLMDRVFAGFRRHGPKKDAVAKKTDLMDFVCYALPTSLFAFGGFSMGGEFGIFGGMFFGLIVGSFFSYRRR